MHPPHRNKRNESGEKSVSILVKIFFFFFFFWRPPEFGRKKRLNFRFRPKNHSQSEFLRFCASNPPPPKFSGSATGQQYTALLRATLTNRRSGQLSRAPHAFKVSKVKLQIRGNQALSTLEEILLF